MQISTSTSLFTSLASYKNKTDLSKCFELAKKAGFSIMDLTLAHYCGNGPQVLGGAHKEFAENVRRDAEKYGITFNQTHGDALNGLQWDDPSCPRFEGFTERNICCIEATKIVGAKWMVLHPMSLPHDPLYSAARAKEANLKHFDPLIECAKKNGIGLAIENMVDYRRNKRRYCAGDPYELLDLVDTINDPSVGICIDTGHAHQAGIDVAEFIRLAGDRLKATHIDDNHADEDTHLLPFYGSIKWQSVAKALADINYQNCFTYELCHVNIPEDALVPWLSFIYKLGESIINSANS